LKLLISFQNLFDQDQQASIIRGKIVIILIKALLPDVEQYKRGERGDKEAEGLDSGPRISKQSTAGS